MSVRMKSIHLFEFSDDYKMGLKDYSGLYKNGIPLKEFLENKNYETDFIFLSYVQATIHSNR